MCGSKLWGHPTRCWSCHRPIAYAGPADSVAQNDGRAGMQPRSEAASSPGGLIACALIVFFFGLIAYSNIQDANRPPRSRSPNLTARSAPIITPEDRLAGAAAAIGLDLAKIRITGEHGRLQSRNSATLYLSQSDVERIPFPDRLQALAGLGRTWCAAVEQHGSLTALTLRDIRTGKRIGFQRCSQARPVLDD